MKQGIVTTLLTVVGIGACLALHPVTQYQESRKVANIPHMVAEAEQIREDVSGYFSDDWLTTEEAHDLYWICKDGVLGNGVLRDSQSIQTEESGRIDWALFNMREEFKSNLLEERTIMVKATSGREYPTIMYGMDVSNSDLGARLDEHLEDFIDYLQTEEYEYLVGPLNAGERVKRNVAFLLSGFP